MTFGDRLTVVTDTGQHVPAIVMFAEPSGRALVLVFRGAIGGWAGQIPVRQDDYGCWSSVDGIPLSLVESAPA